MIAPTSAIALVAMRTISVSGARRIRTSGRSAMTRWLRSWERAAG